MKFCKDCENYKPKGDSRSDKCLATVWRHEGVDLVTGETIEAVYSPCDSERYTGKCGINGKKFIKKETQK